MSSSAAADNDRRAAEWVARADRAPLTDAERGELAAWLAEDARHEGAFLRAEAAWLLLDRGRALSSARSPRPRRVFPRKRPRALAALGALAAAGVAVWTGLPTPAARIETSVGEIRRVPLQDGSVATVNTASDLAVSMDNGKRRVVVRAGEAWFRVAKDADRPFVVAAGEVRVRAVGTAFSVRRRPEGAEVLVTEGVVEAWLAAAPRAVTRLAAGEQAFIGKETQTTAAVAVPVLERRLAWRDGKISLDGETLAKAAAEFNRHNSRQVIVADPALGEERLVGLFDARDPEGFALAAAIALRARATATDERITLSRAAPG